MIFKHLPFLLFFCFITSFVHAEQRFVEEPEDTVARLGETVVLKCRVKNQKGQVIWMKDDIGLGYTRDLPYWERMSMTGSLVEGEYHLEIRNVSLDDEDIYQCQLSSTEDEPHAKLSRKARLTVIVEPQGPVLLGESITATLPRTQPIATTEGHPIRLSCQSREGRPPAQIRWALAEDWQAQRMIGPIGNGTGMGEVKARHPGGIHPMRVREHSPASRHTARAQHLFGNITEDVDYDEGTKLYTLTSHLTFSPTQEENGRWLVCLAAHQAHGPEQRTASIELEVFYAPKVRVEVDTANSQLREGGHARLRCLSDARPNEDLKFAWQWDGEPKRLSVLDSQNALISGLRANDNGRRVSCTVENTIGRGNGILELDVSYGPQFMSTNQTKTVDRGSEVTFQCEVLGNPPPLVRWYHGRDWDTPVFEGKNFTIPNAQDWEEGEYRCSAEVDGFPPSTLYHMLYLKGPPKVRFNEFIVAEGGDKVTLVCEIESRALPLRVHWFHNGRRVDIDQAPTQNGQPLRRYQVHDEKTGRHQLVSRLTINDFNSQEDAGLWNCSAKNEFGIVWEQKDVQVLGVFDELVKYADGLPLYWLIVFLAALGLILSLPLLLLLCCCWRKCCRRKGHSKLSNHSSDQRGEFSVKCEELDGLTSSSTPPYPQPHFYTDPQGNGQQHHGGHVPPPADYLCAGQPYNPDMDQSALYGPQQQQFNDYFEAANGNGHFGGTFGNGGGNGTFVNHSFGSGNNVVNPYDTNTFGLPLIPAQQQHFQPQQQLYQQPQQFYAYQNGVSPLEPVTEVCTLESLGGGGEPSGHLGEEQQLGQHSAERTVSRISTHV